MIGNIYFEWLKQFIAAQPAVVMTPKPIRQPKPDLAATVNLWALKVGNCLSQERFTDSDLAQSCADALIKRYKLHVAVVAA